MKRGGLGPGIGGRKRVRDGSQASFPGEAIGSRIERRVSERFRKGRSKREGKREEGWACNK